MKDKFVTAMQTFSKAIVVPVLYLPAIGLILVICNFITNPKNRWCFTILRCTTYSSLCLKFYTVD